MLRLNQICLIAFLLILSWRSHSVQSPLPINPEKSVIFELVTLGDSGGIQDGNLSAFLLRALVRQAKLDASCRV